MATANFNIKPADGWVEITTAGVSFIKVRSNTPRHAFFITDSVSAPASTVIGYKVDCEEFCCDAPVSGKFYVRCHDNQPQNVRIDVFTVPSA